MSQALTILVNTLTVTVTVIFSTSSTASDRQLHPHPPISYNKALLSRWHGQLQAKIFNNTSLPLPTEDTKGNTHSENSAHNYHRHLTLTLHKGSHNSMHCK